MWVIDADRRRNTWALWLLVPMAVLWTNLHAGFLILFALLGILVIGCLAESFLWGKSGALRYTLLGAACAVGSLINPYGVKLHLYIRDYLNGHHRNSVQEFQSPSFRAERACLYAGAVRGVGDQRLSLEEAHRLTESCGWFLAYHSLVSVRHVPPVHDCWPCRFWQRKSPRGMMGR
jgi:hypothetical protein